MRKLHTVTIEIFTNGGISLPFTCEDKTYVTLSADGVIQIYNNTHVIKADEIISASVRKSYDKDWYLRNGFFGNNDGVITASGTGIFYHASGATNSGPFSNDEVRYDWESTYLRKQSRSIYRCITSYSLQSLVAVHNYNVH